MARTDSQARFNNSARATSHSEAMTTVNRRVALALLGVGGDNRQSLEGIFVGQAQGASRGLHEIACQRASLP